MNEQLKENLDYLKGYNDGLDEVASQFKSIQNGSYDDLLTTINSIIITTNDGKSKVVQALLSQKGAQIEPEKEQN